MAKYRVHNLADNVANEIKPGKGTFTIQPHKYIEVDDKEVAESLVNDSQGKLRLEVLVEKVEELKPTKNVLFPSVKVEDKETK